MEKLLSENVVKLSGDIDDSNLQPLQQAVMTILQGTRPDALLDLSEVPTLSAGAVAMLQQASGILKENGRRLVVISTHRPCPRLLDFDLVLRCLRYEPRRAHYGHGAQSEDNETAQAVAGSKAW